MGLLYKIERVLQALDEVKAGIAQLQGAVEGISAGGGGQDKLQEGIENILRYPGPKGGERK